MRVKMCTPEVYSPTENACLPLSKAATRAGYPENPILVPIK